VAAEYCGLKGYIPHPPGEWTHGSSARYRNIHPELIVGTTGTSLRLKEWKKFWVARKDQEIALREYGYRHVAAIGMPITYLQLEHVPRMPGSLLVMPVHSLQTTQHKWGFDDYAEALAEIRDQFSSVVVCVHPICFKRGYWVEAFRGRGFQVVTGADRFDRYSLRRMGMLFSRFEYVTSNGYGSHLAYSGYYGAKPSIFGPLAQYSADDFKNDGIYLNCPEILPLILDFSSEKTLHRNHGELFADPWLAESRREWAAEELGLDCRRSPAELKRLFGWDAWGITKSVARRLKRSAKRLLVGSD
jgi:hypothetical protein